MIHVANRCTDDPRFGPFLKHSTMQGAAHLPDRPLPQQDEGRPLAQAGSEVFSAAKQPQSGSGAELDLDMLTGLEEVFYQEGFQSGAAHGRLHGTFEGRQLGREKGFEVWEEVGHYAGMARFWSKSLLKAAPDQADM